MQVYSCYNPKDVPSSNKELILTPWFKLGSEQVGKMSQTNLYHHAIYIYIYIYIYTHMYKYPTSCTVKVCYQIESFNPKNRRELATLNTILQ